MLTYYLNSSTKRSCKSFGMSALVGMAYLLKRSLTAAESCYKQFGGFYFKTQSSERPVAKAFW